jgi:hypothetical protein
VSLSANDSGCQGIAVGAPGDGTQSGAVYVYRVSSGSFVEETRLEGPPLFGTRIALGECVLSVTVPERGADEGRVYLFEHQSSGEWVRITEVQAYPEAPLNWGGALWFTGYSSGMGTRNWGLLVAAPGASGSMAVPPIAVKGDENGLDQRTVEVALSTASGEYGTAIDATSATEETHWVIGDPSAEGTGVVLVGDDYIFPWAQPVSVDTLSFLPISVGNRWEYTTKVEIPSSYVSLVRAFVVTRDSTFGDGKTRFEMAITDYDPGSLSVLDVRRCWVAPAVEQILINNRDATPAGFCSVVDRDPVDMVPGHVVFQSGSPVEVGPFTYQVGATAYYGWAFSGPGGRGGGFGNVRYAGGIGRLSKEYNVTCDATSTLCYKENTHLVYSRIGTAEYGQPAVPTVIDDEADIPPRSSEPFLGSAYPNPAKGFIQITFMVTETRSAEIEVFDLMGREVARWTGLPRSGVLNSVGIDATHLGSGIYFYRLQAGDYVETKRMVVVR